MTGNADAVIAGRNYLVWLKAHALANDLPADTVDYGASWPGHTDKGYTSGGLQYQLGLTRGTVRVDQEFDPIVRPVTERTMQLSCNLAEMTPANVQAATGMGTIETLAPAAGVRGHNDLVIGNEVTDQYYSVGYDIKQPDNQAFRIYVYKGLPTGAPSPQFQPGDTPAQIAFQVSALVDTLTTPSRIMRIRDVLPAA